MVSEVFKEKERGNQKEGERERLRVGADRPRVVPSFLDHSPLFIVSSRPSLSVVVEVPLDIQCK